MVLVIHCKLFINWIRVLFVLFMFSSINSVIIHIFCYIVPFSAFFLSAHYRLWYIWLPFHGAKCEVVSYRIRWWKNKVRNKPECRVVQTLLEFVASDGQNKAYHPTESWNYSWEIIKKDQRKYRYECRFNVYGGREVYSKRFIFSILVYSVCFQWGPWIGNGLRTTEQWQKNNRTDLIGMESVRFR